MIVAIINPGTQGIDGATEQDATDNMAALVNDTIPTLTYTRVPEQDSKGRFAYQVTNPEHPGKTCMVLMPGWKLEHVRWLDLPEQNIWHFPRLYVDGSSWVWKYAAEMLVEFWKEDEQS